MRGCRHLFQRSRRNADGSVVIEFALISSVMMALLAATLDLSFMVLAKRDAERSSTLLTHALTSCPPVSATNATLAWRGTDCVVQTMELLKNRMPNLLVSFPNATFGMASIQRVSGVIRMCPGNMTFLPSDMQASALSVLRDDDSGALAYIQIAYSPFLPQSLLTFATATNTTFLQYTVDVRGNGDPYRCAT